MIPDPRPCSSCAALVLDLKHERTGRVAPIDLEPVPHGGTVVIAHDGTYRVLRKVERALLFGDEFAIRPPLHRPHFETCPQADYWRGK